ncbi:hypothetical protein BU17DRAFT_79580 [Hysterangium stoloniferum]|nr:hypothetical protein BU17DRAFT_79580 [Hysterangium stoloniferum]
MSLTPKEIVATFVDHFHNRRFPDVLALTSPSATWWMVGSPNPGSPLCGGAITFSERHHLIAAILNEFEKMTFIASAITAEKDKAALEATLEGEMADGRTYRNEIIMVFTVKEGKIEELKEWLDTAAVIAFIAAGKAQDVFD